ncbi:MAG: DUF882 domain-containing protein [Pseudomonadota bacterium]
MRALIISILVTFMCSVAWAEPPECRYFHHGDGHIKLATNKGKVAFDGRFRNPDGTYDENALRKINRVFLARYGVPISTISLRLIEFLDFLQDHFNPKGRLMITSGYRSPSYNTNLRNNGKLAAKASLHQYGMATDFWLAGVPSKKIWEFVRELNFGGVGFYHGKNVHVDVGPARFWDEATSKVGTDISDDNKLIGIVADKDIYLPGDIVDMRFIRMTMFPIGVKPTFVLERKDKKGEWEKADEFNPIFSKETKDQCFKFNDIGEMLGISWQLPADLKPGRYRVKSSFCDKIYDEMPEEIFTPEFEVIRE